ncbi:MAG TPA: MliC family protein [Amaricoccus sp.]|uniref:MliC family protein n=1 Tax=Amaricoccus sp. TaxID=1872485 RepID=UPI002C4A4C9D|nr:MliC family protein [Amaricoccus sp.]HMR51997.1 MliC family protein [Amaricoccus sp.]HMR59884.1 MliC family protein [Amaricoccus sp.]HMT98799.1 MliC family protein [Amaricoccus sp.]
MTPLGRIAAPALALAFGAAAAQEAPQAVSATYLCAGGALLQVAYLNQRGDPGWAVVAYGGRLVPMQAGPTGSGVRYLAMDGGGLVWHVKGDEGFLARDGGDRQDMLLEDCRRAGSRAPIRP